MKRKLTILLAILFVGFASVGIYDIRKNEALDTLDSIKLEDSLIELNKAELEKKEIRHEFDEAVKQKTIDQQKVQDLEKRDLEKDQEIERLKRELQAKKDSEKTIASAGITPKASAATRPAITGNKESWLRASGIPESDWWAVDSIVSRESGWNPCAYNPGRSDCNANPTSACGLAQSLPCGKQAKYGHWTDPVANLKWQHEYVTQRYGGYPQAVAFWNANHWY